MIEIRIYLGEHQHGMRVWPAVPRVGDHIVVTVDGKIKNAKVDHVLWGITEPSRNMGGQCVVGLECSLSD